MYCYTKCTTCCQKVKLNVKLHDRVHELDLLAIAACYVFMLVACLLLTMFSEESLLFLHLRLFEQEGKLRENCMIGHSDIPLEEKTVTICYGKDMTNIEFVNFVCASKEVAKVSSIYKFKNSLACDIVSM